MYEEMKKAFGKLLDAIPRGKKALVFHEASTVEIGFNKMASVLNSIRQYYLDQPGGEEMPFVKKIDELIPRKK